MALLNIHQLIPGARTKGGLKTYVLSVHKVAPTVAENDPVVELDGTVEFDGRDFALVDLNFSAFQTVLPSGTADYKICAVPKYTEPADRTAAGVANVNYYVTPDGNGLGESFVHYFLPAALEASVAAEGGYVTLSKLVAMGAASQSQITLFNKYSDELEKLSDPRYVGHLLEPVGVEYIVVKVAPQDNRSKTDALAAFTDSQILQFLATQGYVPARYVTGTLAAQHSAFGSKLKKVKRAFAFTSLVNADNNVGAIEVRLNDGDTLSAPKDLNGSALSGSYTHIGLWEYYMPTYMSRGHEGLEDAVIDVYTKGDASVLGRVNPIYLARDLEVARVSAGRGRPYAALTKYADPLVVAEANVTVTTGVAVVNSAVAYTGKLLDLV